MSMDPIIPILAHEPPGCPAVLPSGGYERAALSRLEGPSAETL